MTEASDLACYPWSASTWLVAGWGVVTAGMSWFFPGANLVSQGSHALVGAGLLAFALWGVWRPRVVITGGQLVERPGAGRRERTLLLADVAGVLRTPRTGHRPSEEDLDRQLGLRLRSGDFRWIDLRWIRSTDRERLRAGVGATEPEDSAEPTDSADSAESAD